LDAVTLTLIFGTLIAILALGFWVATTLLVVGLISMEMFTGAPVGSVMSTTIWGASSSWGLTALPLFVWMGEILFRSRLSEDLFAGLSVWMTRIPGRLVHANVVGCAVFAAVSGSSAATSATVGKISLPELRRRGYDEGISVGTLAGSGTLGLMIPPSIMMIVYGIAAEVSIGRLFIAGILPGLMLVVLFMGYVIAWSVLNPGGIPDSDQDEVPLAEKIWRLRLLLPVIGLIVAVVSSIYTGIATASEAAALGVLGSLLLSFFSGTLNWKTFIASVEGAVKTGCMLTFILVCAAFLSKALAFAGIPQALASTIAGLNLSPMALLLVLTLFFLILGCFLDGISIVVVTTPIILPLMTTAGFDPLWFGIYIVLVAEMAQITPPVGLNLFVLQGMTGHDIWYVSRVTFPLFIALLIAVVIIAIFPELALLLPEGMRG